MDLKWEYDATSSIWLQPFSLLLNNLFPVECVYCEWFYWQAKDHTTNLSSMREVTYSTGSRTEGFCIPDLHLKNPGDLFFTPNEDYRHWISDEDTMTTKNFRFETEDGHKLPMFDIEHVKEDQRYVHLKLTEEWKKDRPRFKDSLYLHQIFLLPSLNSEISVPSFNDSIQESIQGPVHKTYREGRNGLPTGETDTTTVFTYPTAWPEAAMEWLIRPREHGWPSPELVEDIFESSCHIAPVGRGRRTGDGFTILEYMKNPLLAEQETKERPNDMDEMEWRISFSVAENKLGSALPPVPRQAMVLLKMLKKLYLPEGISTYHLKNILFWEVEKQNKDFWTERNVAKCLLHLIDCLQDCLKLYNLPHYFIPESNLLSSISKERSIELATAVEELRIGILDRFVSMIFRLHSNYYFLQDVSRKLVLDECFVKMKDNNICPKNIKKLYIDILIGILDAVKPTLNTINTTKSKESDSKLLIQVSQYTFLSLLARLLCEVWVMKDTAVSFLGFVEESTKDIPLMNDKKEFDSFKDICFQYLAFTEEENAPILNGIQTVIFPVKEIQRARYEEINKSLPPVYNWLKPGDTDGIVDIVTKQVKEMGIDNLSNADIMELMNEQFNKLFQQMSGNNETQ